MKADMDGLMAERGFDGLLILGDETYNPPRNYLAPDAHVTGGLVVKKRGQPAIIIANPMETEEATRSGLAVYSWNELGWAELLEAAEGDRSRVQVGLWERALKKAGVESGKIALYGKADVNTVIELARLAQETLPDYEFVGELGLTLFDEAYTTKDSSEAERLQSVARRTSEVWQATWDFIAGHRAQDETVVDANGTALTIGAVKGFVRAALLQRGLTDTGMIFAQGRDAGFPHSRGQDDMPLKLGQAIVFDLFPQEAGGGYYHDSTRTWCIGYAPEEVQKAYDEVMEAFDVAVDTFRIGQPTHMLQEAVQTYFEERGHPTLRSHPGTPEGYVHGLGHGVGLNIHERPGMSHLAKSDSFQRGNVISIEPGLYYPERGFGVRIEDLFYVDDGGQLITLTDFHKELILPLGSNN